MNMSEIEIESLSIGDARNLIAELQEYVKDQEKLTPTELREHIANLPELDGVAGVENAAAEFYNSVASIYRDYIKHRCDDDAFTAYEDGEFDDAIDNAVMDAIEEIDFGAISAW